MLGGKAQIIVSSDTYGQVVFDDMRKKAEPVQRSKSVN